MYGCGAATAMQSRRTSCHAPLRDPPTDPPVLFALYVFIGSAIGGVSRLAIGSFIQTRSGVAFPVGTLVVNITGSLLLGIIWKYALATPSMTAETRALLTTGFCGGYTTFSTYSLETATLFEAGDYGRGLSYAAASVLLSLGATFVGFRIAKILLEARA
jgi:CrcB protein